MKDVYNISKTYLKVYMIELEMLGETDYSDLSNKEFANIAKEQTTVFTLTEFANMFNREENLGYFNIIRIF